MDKKETQDKLNALYIGWKEKLQFTEQEADSLSPPLLLSVTEDYCQADKRVLFFGQETAGWGWTKDLRRKHPRYPHDWPYRDIWQMGDFKSNQDGVEGLCWGYREFAFARWQPDAYGGPFWQAFREVQTWPGVGIMWNNVAKADYSPPPEGKGGNSILRAPQLQDALITQQAGLLAAEIAILKPHVCLFFTGPYYDPVISGTLPGCEFEPCDELSVRKLARLAHPSLPAASFRTYHPNYLRQSGNWGYIEKLRIKVYGDERS